MGDSSSLQRQTGARQELTRTGAKLRHGDGRPRQMDWHGLGEFMSGLGAALNGLAAVLTVLLKQRSARRTSNERRPSRVSQAAISRAL